MAQMTAYAPGTFCWPELSTTDTKGAKEFYGAIFGWTPADVPAGPGNVYTMLESKGLRVGALHLLRPELRDAGVPPHWLSYASIENADAGARKAAGLGGKLLAEPFDVMDVGRMCVVQDPTGAVFALWEPRLHLGAQLVNEPVSLVWNELMTNDMAAAGKFYTGLFGWTEQSMNMGSMKYTTFRNGANPAGGLFEITPEMGPVPPNWMVYFAVEDCDKVAEAAKAHRGAVVVAPHDIPTVGRSATLKDPQGAYFSVIKMQTA